MDDTALRAGLLDGIVIALAGASDGPLGEQVHRRCGELGGHVARLDVKDKGEEATAAAIEALQADLGAVDVLVNDGASLFAQAEDGLPALRACLDGCWNAVRAVANAAFIDEGATARGGRIITLAPALAAGAHAAAARAGLENLGRTLSIEWARHGIVTSTIAPGVGTDPARVAELVAFLASSAGSYYSGCLFELDSCPGT